MNGDYERPPAIVFLQRTGSDAQFYQTQKFMIISMHTKPVTGVADMTTENEINKLSDVYQAEG